MPNEITDDIPPRVRSRWQELLATQRPFLSLLAQAREEFPGRDCSRDGVRVLYDSITQADEAAHRAVSNAAQIVATDCAAIEVRAAMESVHRMYGATWRYRELAYRLAVQHRSVFDLTVRELANAIEFSYRLTPEGQACTGFRGVA